MEHGQILILVQTGQVLQYLVQDLIQVPVVVSPILVLILYPVILCLELVFMVLIQVLDGLHKLVLELGYGIL